MISLKNKYLLSLSGWALLFFGLGWMVLDMLLPVSVPYFSMIGTGIGLGGLGIVIATLRTIKGKIEFDVEDVKEIE